MKRMPPAPAPGVRRAAGFTLLEIMVAMLLLSIIVTSSVTLLFLNIRGWDALTGDSEQSLDTSLINDRLRGAIGRLSHIVRQTPEGRRLAFEGDPKHLHFVSAAPQQFASGGLFEYLLQEELDSGNRYALVLYYAPYRPDGMAFVLPNAGEKRILVADTGGVTFAYYGIDKRGGQPAWRERWDRDLEGYPRIVKLIQADTAGGFGEGGQFIRLLTTDAARLR